MLVGSCFSLLERSWGLGLVFFYLNDNPPLSDIDLLSQIWSTRLSQQWSKTTMLAGY
jgi:hypothetical protein